MEAKNKLLNYIHKKWLHSALMALPLLASALLLSCVDGQEEIATSNSEGEARVSVHVSVGPIGDLNATRATDTNATDGELINSLCLFIVDSDGKIEAKIQPDLTGTNAESGNLEDYTSDVMTITSGWNKIYAFANWDNVGSEEWDALIAKNTGDEITDDKLKFTISNPAATIDLTNECYIPMSGWADVNLVGDLNSTQTVSVELIRLVGKVQVNVTAVEQDLTVESLAFDGTADKVWLFGDEDLQGSNDISRLTTSPTITLSTTAVTAGNTETIATFYVNESLKSYVDVTPAQSGFKVTLDTGPYKGYTSSSSYTSTITKIPRNNIYVINLNLDRYATTATAIAYTSILGVDGQVEYSAGAFQTTTGEYVLSLYDVTSKFILTAEMTDTQAETEKQDITSSVNWEWGYKGTDTEENNEGAETSELTVTKLTATTHTYEYTLTANWTDDTNIPHSRTYTIIVELDNTSKPPLKSAPAKQSGEEPVTTIWKKTETFK